jgi:DNA-directed RNA polymerase subunit M/transcription elongation factor TFIIS
MDIYCDECKSLLSITHVEIGSLGNVEFQVEVCQECLDKKQDEIDTLEANLEDYEHWEAQCIDLESQLEDALSWEARCMDLEARLARLENK